jgi:hypothetical protein
MLWKKCGKNQLVDFAVSLWENGWDQLAKRLGPPIYDVLKALISRRRFCGPKSAVIESFKKDRPKIYF